MPTLNSHTHCQVAPANASTKALSKIVSVPTHGRQDIAANLNIKTDRTIISQPLTSGIKHWGLSGYASVLPRIKFGVTGQDCSPQSPTISYRQPLGAIIQDKTKGV